jgi:hypothetical protein
MQSVVALDPMGAFDRGPVLGKKLLVELLRQHPQDLHRVVRGVLLHRLSAHKQSG